ncbi:RNA polymerase-binding ATPase [Halobacteriovorax marinus]|uniref:RNA polymerase-associated protein RapA n=1 Tax=Halobacteriovorax marinus TaxID=97084 RepID=UPI000BC32AE3|nr:RNA polymerase-associated protein RapA [Halobacteriovorax marinus]ATH08539.1 RNA polymerase-binding ATPase [Halobacteriovorax marinus]
MNKFTIGQRWISEAEPELGLGIINNLTDKTVSIVFSASGIERNYGIKTCPIKRVLFGPGDEILIEEGERLLVDKVTEQDGLAFYLCGERIISELDLSDLMSFNKPEDKLLNGLCDPHEHFQLRYETLKYKNEYSALDVKGLLGPRVSLIPHQLYVAKEVFNRPIPRVLLADEVGLGKTIEAAMIIHQMLISKRAQRILIVVPDSLVFQWFIELHRKFALSFTVVNQETELAPGTNPFLDNENIIVSLGLLRGAEKARELLNQADFDMLVVDEAHHLKWSREEASVEYKLVESLAARISGVLLLTATPEQLGLEGHFSRLKILDPDRFFSYEDFVKEHESFEHFAGIVRKIEGGVDLDVEEKELLTSVGIDANQEKEEIISSLLDRHGTGRIYIRNTRERMKEVFDFFPQRILNEDLIDLDAKTDNLDVNIFRSKAFWLIEKLQDLKGEKALLICKSKAKVLALEKFIRENATSTNTAVFHSDLSLMARDRQAAYFADDNGAQILLCTEIGSEGRNFEFASNLILFDLPSNPDYLEQRIGRLDRIGQKRDIQIHVPLVKESSEHLLFRWYQEGFNAFTDAAKCGGILFRKFKDEVEDIENQDIDSLIERTRAEYKLVSKELEEGRDVLIEKNSYKSDKALSIRSEIRDIDQSRELRNFLDSVFHHLGVDSDDINEDTLFLRPTDNMLLPHFPELDRDGKTYTFNRLMALEREEFGFLTWDHPMVQGVSDLIISESIGSYSVAKRRESKGTKIFFEFFFIFETIHNQELESNKYFPPKVIRVLLDNKGEDFSEKWDKSFLDSKVSGGDRDDILKVSKFPKAGVTKIITKANEVAREIAARDKDLFKQNLTKLIARDVERLTYLKSINSSVKDEELQWLEMKKSELLSILDQSSVKLDSFRVIL